MFIETDFNEAFEQIDDRCKELLEQALTNESVCTLNYSDVSYELVDDFYASQPNHDSVYIVMEGAVAHEQENATLFHYDIGDIFGLDQINNPSPYRLYSAGPFALRRYNRAELLNALTSNTPVTRIWCEYLLEECKRRTCIISLVEQGVDKASLGFVHYQVGDVIIEQDTEADSVYSIVEGQADVFVNDTKVGEVLENEIFGAMALLTNSLRTAKVVASSTCMILVVPKEQFETLMKTHPHICLNLMKSMASQIVSLNEQVTSND
ncbi:MAG: cyclic nucleotide-binding domain-containing protein [Pseudomonadales bacterium]|nr:cyclic nucleotide-binding domain-containing protein [Pseudomonadales bacterium]